MVGTLSSSFGVSFGGKVAFIWALEPVLFLPWQDIPIISLEFVKWIFTPYHFANVINWVEHIFATANTLLYGAPI